MAENHNTEALSEEQIKIAIELLKQAAAIANLSIKILESTEKPRMTSVLTAVTQLDCMVNHMALSSKVLKDACSEVSS